MMNKYQQRLKKDRARIRHDEKLQYKAGQLCMNVLGVVPAYVMCVEFGWGNKRLTRFIEKYEKVLRAVNTKQISIQRLEEEILNRSRLQHDDGSWHDMTDEIRMKRGKKNGKC